MPERIRIEPIQRFIGKDFYKCGNNVFVDNKKTNVMIRLNSGIFRIFELREWDLNLNSSDYRASKIIFNDT